MAELTVQEVWDLFTHISRTNTNTDILRKMAAFNEGYSHLCRRMIIRGEPLPELLSIPTDIATVEDQNYVDLPDDFLSMKELYVNVSGDFIMFGENQIVSFDVLREQTGQRFLDTSDTGVPSLAAVKEPYIYFDRHFEDDDADGLKIIYNQLPATQVAYDRLTLTGITGTFQEGEIVTGSSSGQTATVYAVGSTYIDVTSQTRLGSFAASETITGETSGATGIYSSISQKPAVLEVSEKYKMALALAMDCTYLWMKDELELEAKNASLEQIITDFQAINKNNESLSFGLSGGYGSGGG